VPEIIRPVSGTQEKELCFVGESDVHGIMDGEIMMILDGKDYPCGRIYTRVSKRNSLPHSLELGLNDNEKRELFGCLILVEITYALQTYPRGKYQGASISHSTATI
jgi:hypothetical protein